jgi:hypothetical protein
MKTPTTGLRRERGDPQAGLRVVCRFLFAVVLFFTGMSSFQIAIFGHHEKGRREMGSGARVNEVEFREAREIIMRVHERIGQRTVYTRGDFERDQKLIRDSAQRKRFLRQQEAAQFVEIQPRLAEAENAKPSREAALEARR